MSYDYATQRGNVVPFKGNFALSLSDIGKLFRCDDTANITVTVPSPLPDGFNVAFVMGSTGTVTIATDGISVNRSGKTALSAQYQVGSLLVIKTTSGNAEFVLGGDFA